MRTATADSATYTSDVRVIGKCPWCKTPVAGVAHIETTQRATISGVVTMSRVVGGSAKYRDPRRPQYGYVVDHACPEITDEVSVYVQVKPVSGTVTAKACDARCENARQASCECSCGGQNHGSAWG